MCGKKSEWGYVRETDGVRRRENKRMGQTLKKCTQQECNILNAFLLSLDYMNHPSGTVAVVVAAAISLQLFVGSCAFFLHQTRHVR